MTPRGKENRQRRGGEREQNRWIEEREPPRWETIANLLQIKSVKELSGQTCQICGDEIEITIDGELFVTCNECAFPVCRPCYEYERREGNQACPHCKTRYKRLKGSPRVEGDEEEDDIDDLEHEFDYGNLDDMGPEHVAEAMLTARLNTGRGATGPSSQSELDATSPSSQIPLLTYGEEVWECGMEGSNERMEEKIERQISGS